MNNDSNQNYNYYQPEQQEALVDLRHYWRVILQFKWQILLLSLLITTVAALFAFSQQPIYQASTKILIENRQPKFMSSVEDFYGASSANQDYYFTQHEILRSRDLAERVVKKLDLQNHPLFGAAPKKKGLNWRSIFLDETTPNYSDEQRMRIAVSRFISGLSIVPVGKTHLVQIVFNSPNPSLAAKITDSLAAEYIASYAEGRKELTQDASSWLFTRLEELRAKLVESEQRLQTYREDAKLIDVSGVQTLDVGEISQLTRSYSSAKDNLLELKTVYNQIKRLSAPTSSEQYLTVPEIINDPLVSNFKQAEAEASLRVAELSKRYGPKHPKMIAALTDQYSSRSQLHDQIDRKIKSITTAYNAALQKKLELEQQLQSSKKGLLNLNRKEFQLKELQREVDTNRNLYETFLVKAKETQESQGLEAAIASIVDSANVPTVPILPRKQLIISVAFILSIFLGVGLAITLDSMNNTVRSPDDVEYKLHSPLLGFLPLVKSNRSEKAFEGFLSDTKSGFSEAVRTIRTSAILSNLDDPKKITMVTSTVPNEGKSTLSLNLAEALGQMERVLLIDADLRRPSIGKALNFPPNMPGLTNLIAGTSTLKDCVVKLNKTSLYIMPSGVVPSNPLELISSKKFKLVLDALQKKFDRIVIDTSPTQSVSDSLVLSTNASSVVYVVKADHTSAPLAAKGIKKLREVGATITGVVLNQVDLEKAAGYDSYYAEYYNSYGYGNDESNNKESQHEQQFEPKLG